MNMFLGSCSWMLGLWMVFMLSLMLPSSINKFCNQKNLFLKDAFIKPLYYIQEGKLSKTGSLTS
jgi:hypothetical protein